ncbi:hypothetical protein AVEN_253589-1 [Araneus ventricosus]|uniref:Uncharacterized protein n=1 Tax=Araneus ventricosus TaxID=182803 RepID=A0A4Y2CA39_ARAVE|nr:hypothetical protein AVEN_253589-1 [Araneus ventricosus]
MTRTTPDPSSSFRTVLAGGRLAHDVRFNVHQGRIHGGASVELGFEPGVSQWNFQWQRMKERWCVHLVTTDRRGSAACRSGLDKKAPVLTQRAHPETAIDIPTSICHHHHRQIVR